ncbi:polysaccharide pyruvyl transferase family protein [Vibrio sp. FNV 38]|nr:polysaccharide pyruvyl transferase family protein [Vibrio sp. FNV 38]
MSVGIIGTPGRVFGLSTKSFEQVFSEAGGNTGNLLFQYASSKMFLGKRSFFNWDTDPNLINKSCKVLILPLANQIGTHTDYARRAEMISKIEIPIIALGLGAQNHTMTPESVKVLSDKITLGTQHWLEEISQRTSKILVRGDYTVSVCNELGISNVESFGCPSNLISKKIRLGRAIESQLENVNCKSIILNGGFYNKGKSNYDRIVALERKVIKDAAIDDCSIVVQAPKDIMSYSYSGGGYNDRVDDVSEGLLQRARLDSFYDVDSWSHHTRNFDLSIGTRIHGAMLSLQFGHPTVLITHDSRTNELSDIMCLPRMSLNDALKCDTVNQMIENVNFSADEYDFRRFEMAQQLNDVFQDAGLTVAPHIKTLYSQL